MIVGGKGRPGGAGQALKRLLIGRSAVQASRNPMREVFRPCRATWAGEDILPQLDEVGKERLEGGHVEELVGAGFDGPG